MIETKVINGEEFAKYDNTYYVSKDGKVFSTYVNRLLTAKPDLDGYPRLDIHGKHKKNSSSSL